LLELFLAGMRDVLGETLAAQVVVQVRGDLDMRLSRFIASIGAQMIGVEIAEEGGEDAVLNAGRRVGTDFLPALPLAPKRFRAPLIWAPSVDGGRKLTAAVATAPPRHASLPEDALRHVRFPEESDA